MNKFAWQYYGSGYTPKETEMLRWLFGRGDDTQHLIEEYLEAVEDEENPIESGARLGYTARELGNRRRVRHDKVMKALAKEGFDVSDRAVVTEQLQKYQRWMGGER